MFFYENYQWINILGILILVFALFLINELTRRNKWVSISVFLILPVVLTFFVWPHTAKSDVTDGNWFAWVKTYSALLGVIGFMALRYSERLRRYKAVLFFPFVILSLNILEAIFRDFQVSTYDSVIENGLLLQGGPWNIMNGIAGIFTILTLTGWAYIRIANKPSRDLIWADQLWFYIVGYTLWNISYVYNCIPDRSFYTGVILLSTAMFSGFVVAKGAWLQHRAQTLALFGMFTLTMPMYASWAIFSIVPTHSDAAKMFLSISALVFNVGVFVYQMMRVVKMKRNPYTQELYANTKSYEAIMKDNNLTT